MKKFIVSMLIGFALLIGFDYDVVQAQTVVQYDTSTVSWSFVDDGTGGGAIANYQVSCGTATGGPYNFSNSSLMPSTQLSVPVNNFIPAASVPGEFFCIVRGINSAGEVQSNEVHMQVVNEFPPSGTLTLVVNP